MYGGCLSLLCASLGTPYEIRTDGTILFIEDRAERPYRIDRMLMQLKLAGKFEGCAGIVFGEMIDCDEAGALDYTLQDIIMRCSRRPASADSVRTEVRPCFQRSITLPFGVQAKLQAHDRVGFGYEAAVQVANAS